jgi:hypothetical protein
MGRVRYSILSLMGAVVVAALGLAAVRASSPPVAGATIYVTCGLLTLAVVAAVCSSSDRAWWRGFALSGWTYVLAVFFPQSLGAEPPTIKLFAQVASWAGAPPPAYAYSRFSRLIDANYAAISHCVWALAIALVGAGLARTLFASPPALMPTFDGVPRTRWWRPGIALLILSASVVVTALALLASTSELAVWAGATVFFTFASLGVALFAAAICRGRWRVRWLGAGLFGLVCLGLPALGRRDLEVWPQLLTERFLAAADPLLRVLIRGYPDSSQSVAAADARARRALEIPISAPFRDGESPLKVLEYIQETTRTLDGKTISIDIAPSTRGEMFMSRSYVRRDDFKGVPLAQGLRRCLGRHDLTYYVRDGGLSICRADQGAPVKVDPFSLVGHCLLALMAAGLGGLGGGWIWRFAGDGDRVAAGGRHDLRERPESQRGGSAMRSGRSAIALVMGAALVAALNFAALKWSSPARAGVAIMVTCAVLALAVVGAVCRAGATRAWWAGFALFGSGYLAAAVHLAPLVGELPTIWLLEAIASKLGAAPAFVAHQWGPEIDPSYRWIGHCLWALTLGCLAGALTRLLCAQARTLRDRALGEPWAGRRTRLGWWRGPGTTVALLSTCIVITSLWALGSIPDLPLWSGATLILTFAVVGLALLGAVFGRANRRARWLGAALFSLGYLSLVALGHPDLQTWPYVLTLRVANVAEPLLRRVVSGYQPTSTSSAAANARVYQALGKRVPIRFPEDTRLEDVLQYIVEATSAPDGKKIPVYVHPRTASHEVNISGPEVGALDLEKVPLFRSLRLVLAQNDYTYHVAGGILHIADFDTTVRADHDAFFIVGHCLTALMAAGVGGLLGGWVWRGCRRADVATPAATPESAPESPRMG